MENVIPEEDMRYMVPSTFPLRTVKKCHTKNRLFRDLKPLRAKIIPHDMIKINLIKSSDVKQYNEPMLLSIIEDYDN